MVPRAGVEPATHRLRVCCAANCAIKAFDQLKWRHLRESNPHLRFCRPPPIPVLTKVPQNHLLVRVDGIEPSTSALSELLSNQLRYTRICKSIFKDPCELFIQHNILYHIEMKCTHIFGPPGWIRTCTWRILSSLPLPVGLQEDLTIENDERKFVLALLNPLQA